MRRREFIKALSGSLGQLSFAVATIPPITALAQSPGRLLRIGVLMAEAEDLGESQARKTAFEDALSQLGWKLAINYRWGITDPERAQAASAELVGLGSELIVAIGTPAAKGAQQSTHTIPIVFVAVSEPVTQGLVANLAHPGGNATGFSFLEASLGTKWLEVLKRMSPRLTRILVFSRQAAPQTTLFFNSVQAAASRFAVEAVAAHLFTPADLEATLTHLADDGTTGLIIPPDPFTTEHHNTIVDLAYQHHLPTMAAFRVFPASGGLASYGVSVPRLLRQAAAYVDRIMKGDRPSDLPVQQPTKFEFIINLKVAKAMGLDVPSQLLFTADEVIE
jgi:putative ABC transport system substrate-binding protein